jgi:hypothetical protein
MKFKGQAGAFIAGCIGYRDQFGVLYRTPFVFDFRPLDSPYGTIPFFASVDYSGKTIPGQWQMVHSSIDQGIEDHRKSQL